MQGDLVTVPPPLEPWACDICGGAFRNYDLAYQHAEWDHPRMRFEDTKAALRQLPPTFEPPNGWAEPTVERKTNGFAIASLVISLMLLSGLVFPLGLVLLLPTTLVFGHKSLRQIKRSDGAELGRGMAIIGLVIGYMFLALVAAGALMALSE